MSYNDILGGPPPAIIGLNGAGVTVQNIFQDQISLMNLLLNSLLLCTWGCMQCPLADFHYRFTNNMHPFTRT